MREGASPGSSNDSRIVAPKRAEEDVDLGLRPVTLDEFIGQRQLRANLRVFVEAAKARDEHLDHVLFHGPPGLGKTTLAQIVARELGVGFRATSGPVIAKAGDLAALLTNLEERDVLFIDEIHRLSPIVEEILYPALEDYIEQERPCRRQGDGSLVSRQAATREHSFSEREVACLMPEALLAEIVRHAMLEDSLEYSHDVGRGRYLAQCNPKVVGAMRAALEFASVASGLKNTDTFRPEAAPVRLLCAGTPNAEPLARHSVSILESGVAYIR